jgi:hypothetical protein
MLPRANEDTDHVHFDCVLQCSTPHKDDGSCGMVTSLILLLLGEGIEGDLKIICPTF